GHRRPHQPRENPAPPRHRRDRPRRVAGAATLTRRGRAPRRVRSGMTIPPERRAQHVEWLMQVTAIPTAAGHEGRVTDWIDRWVADRPGVVVRRDPHGNAELRLAAAPETD